MRLKHNILSICIILFLTFCFVWYILNSLPTEEIYNIQKLLNSDGIRAYAFFSLLLLLLLVAVIFLYNFLFILIRLVSKSVFNINNDNNIAIVNYIFLATLGFSLLINTLLGIWSNTLMYFIFNPATVFGVLCITVYLWRKLNGLNINHIIYIILLYAWLVLINAFLQEGFFNG